MMLICRVANYNVLDLRFRLTLTLKQCWHACTQLINYFRLKVQGDINSKIMLIIMCAHELHKVQDDINSKQC